MVTIDGKWVMEGLTDHDPNRIKSSKELSAYINEVGFLPLFKNCVSGFSVEEITGSNYWWSDKPAEDPWEWREVIAAEGEIAYGKLFGNRAGFVSKEWYPYLASYRRDGYDFDSRYEDGLASYRTKRIMDVLESYDELLSNQLKEKAGFGKGGEKGFEGAITTLQMQTYIAVRSFRRRCNKKQEEYGWSVASYTLSENLFGRDHVRSAYDLSAAQAKEKIVDWIISKFPAASRTEVERAMK